MKTFANAIIKSCKFELTSDLLELAAFEFRFQYNRNSPASRASCAETMPVPSQAAEEAIGRS